MGRTAVVLVVVYTFVSLMFKLTLIISLNILKMDVKFEFFYLNYLCLTPITSNLVNTIVVASKLLFTMRPLQVRGRSFVTKLFRTVMQALEQELRVLSARSLPHYLDTAAPFLILNES